MLEPRRRGSAPLAYAVDGGVADLGWGGAQRRTTRSDVDLRVEAGERSWPHQVGEQAVRDRRRSGACAERGGAVAVQRDLPPPDAIREVGVVEAEPAATGDVGGARSAHSSSVPTLPAGQEARAVVAPDAILTGPESRRPQAPDHEGRALGVRMASVSDAPLRRCRRRPCRSAAAPGPSAARRGRPRSRPGRRLRPPRCRRRC